MEEINYKEEFDVLFSKYYLANETINDLKKENHKKDRQIQRLLEEIRDLKIRLGDKIWNYG